MTGVLTAEQVRSLLTDVLTALSGSSEPSCVYVIGGAAIALENPARVATNDIDGYIRHAETRQIIDATEILAPVQLACSEHRRVARDEAARGTF